MPTIPDSAAKFDLARTGEYAQQSRIALAGYDACHELAACMLASNVAAGEHPARILVAGAGGTAQEILTTAPLEPAWTFTAVDPSAPMLDLARASLAAAGLTARATLIHGDVDALPATPGFDGATLIGVLHHVPGDTAKAALLAALACRLKPGAPLVLAGNYRRYADHPPLLDAWRQRWRMHGASADEIERKLAKILEGADPPESEEAVQAWLRAAGFDAPLRFFGSLFWGAWIAKRTV
ncbi:class I SAM-dependent methyltransferase [Burkholderia alba]|uniref:class I SAM-dependent methyltransferase n=1 Tax=Burkholderia alba TaxID=2683677 RepID=UPI002B05D84F|nr:class I SAM-dependent methyltransferase [Burkholderia alba]